MRKIWLLILVIVVAGTFWQYRVWAKTKDLVNVSLKDGMGVIFLQAVNKNLTVESFLKQSGITLEEEDKLNYQLSKVISQIEPNDKGRREIEITRIKVVEEMSEFEITASTVVKSDKDMFLGEEKIIQKGKNGKVKVIQSVRYENGQEVARTEVGREIIVPTVNKIILKGTKKKEIIPTEQNSKKLKLGKKHKGQASWYKHKGGLFAANPWLPMGSRVKVTNRANGKSVVVTINDRGPFVPGRIIDLDKVAFEKIASPGVGVIEIVMREVVEKK